MNERRWVNQHQPQTLYLGTILAYLQAVLGLVNILIVGGASIFGLLVIAGLGGGAYGIANEKKWGYALCVSAAIVQVLFLLLIFGAQTFTSFGPLVDFGFDAALVALLLHPMSRDYQRIWFR